jgi:phosphatidylserine/phosphatidylglycerophosphate/cardiolipin synthase-like enzyme
MTQRAKRRFVRISEKDNSISVFAVAGTYVVVLGFDATDIVRKGLLGFAIHRTDRTENEQYWLLGFRTFKETHPSPPPGSLISTYDNPVQDFLWSDFTAKPQHEYVYKVVPVSGDPKNLQYGAPVEVLVKTEAEYGATHSVFFNRGVIGSQAYAREFHNIAPDKLPGTKQEEAYTWLSRGLEEAMILFIQRAKTKRHALRAAVYEFDYDPVITELGEAQKRCGDVQIVYDARIPSSDDKKIATARKRVGAVKKALKSNGLSGGATPRTSNGNFIAHNKFIVFMEGDKPLAVWTGSTNFTESGIFGQSNVGHIVEDENIAAEYLKYWERLQRDPEEDDIRKENENVSPDITGYPPPAGATTIFSPRPNLAMLDWYGDPAMKSSSKLLCFTAAFGINKLLLNVLKARADHLRYIFLEKWAVKKADALAVQTALGVDHYNQVAVGGYLSKDVLTEYIERRWIAERSNSISKNIRFVHTKYLLIDPLGEDPLVISGSANFSDASTHNNDENMLVILGDKRVADIYLGEFMRLWRHHRFRYIENKLAEEGNGDEYEPNYLDPTSEWASPYYKTGTVKYKKRKAFCGPDPVGPLTSKI